MKKIITLSRVSLLICFFTIASSYSAMATKLVVADFQPCLVVNGTIKGEPNSTALFPNPITAGQKITIISKDAADKVIITDMDGNEVGTYSVDGAVDFPIDQVVSNGWFDESTAKSLNYTGFVIPSDLKAGNYRMIVISGGNPIAIAAIGVVTVFGD